ncbi:MAG: sugar phosphate isomerase/epimerase [Chloroflexi bacterium]|nr:sugar phosphate isomerase/epimerase [Chloroflexota bacterium]
MEFSVFSMTRFDVNDLDASITALIDYLQALKVRTMSVPLPRNDDGTYNFRVAAEVVRRFRADGIRPATTYGPGDPPIEVGRPDDDADTRRALNQQAADNIARIAEAGIPMLVMFARLARGETPAARQKSWDITIAAFETMTAAAEKAGLVLGAHGLYNTPLHNYEEQRALVDAIPSPNLGICYDPICTAINGRAIREDGDYLTPITLLRGKITFIHTRDMARGPEPGTGVELPIGDGEVDHLGILQRLHDIDYRGVVQIEHMRNDLAYARSLGYLRGMLKAGVRAEETA